MYEGASPPGAGGALGAAPDALVGVDPLVRHGGDLGRVLQQARDEGAADLGELVLRARLVERVPVAFEERQVRVHSAARVLAERLRHERRLDALLQRHLLHDQAERHDVVRGGQRVGVAEVDLLLARCALVVGELDRDAHGLQHGDRLAAEVHADVLRGVVEVAGVVGRGRAGAVDRLVLQEEELDLGVGVEGEAQVGGLGQGALEDVARVGEGRGAVRHEDVAEHPGGTGGLRAPRQDLEGRRVRLGDHVGLVHPGEALDGRAVEADALVKRLFQFGGGHGDGLQEAQDVREPQAYETDVALLQRTEHELLLLVHLPLPPIPCWSGRLAPERRETVGHLSIPPQHHFMRVAHLDRQTDLQSNARHTAGVPPEVYLPLWGCTARSAAQPLCRPSCLLAPTSVTPVSFRGQPGVPAGSMGGGIPRLREGADQLTIS